MTLGAAYGVLQRMLTPLSVDGFLGDVLGRRFVKLSGKDCPGRTELLGPDPERSMLNAYARLSAKITFHASGALGPPPAIEPLESANAFQEKIGAFHDLAYTVRIPEVRILSPALDEFLRALEYHFLQPADAEVFWSRAGAKAPVHYDDVDLIAIQLRGRKHWYISGAPSALPNAWPHIPEGPARLDQPVELDMEPGDLLYMPRGTYHTVYSTTDSVHVSIGFVPLTLREAIIACVDHLSDRSRPFREMVGSHLGLQTQRNNFGSIPGSIQEGLAVLSKAAQTQGFLSDALQSRASRVIGKLPKLERPRERTIIDLSTVLRQTSLGVHHLSGNADKIDFAYPGGHEYVHRGVEESVAFIARTPQFTVRDIPGEIGDDVRISLVEKFVAIGFLEASSG